MTSSNAGQVTGTADKDYNIYLVYRGVPEQRAAAGDLPRRRGAGERLRARRFLPTGSGREPQGRRAGQAAPTDPTLQLSTN